MLLEVENLSINFETARGRLMALREISFQMDLGETLGVVGESGCGKSITNLALMGLLPSTASVSADKMSFLGRDLLSLRERGWRELRGSGIAMIFQDPMSALNPSLSVGFQLEETLKIHHPRMTRGERREKAMDLLNLVGISDVRERIKSYAHELSGGLSQRVMIAMAISGEPRLLIADEPTTALDVTIQNQILRLLKGIQKKSQMGLIFVTHDLGVVSQMADQIHVMYAGEIVERGSTQDIICRPCHPYTEGLLHSVPHQESHSFRQRLSFIPGLSPKLTEKIDACLFSPRCSYVQSLCQAQKPDLTKVGEQSFRCFFPITGSSSSPKEVL